MSHQLRGGRCFLGPPFSQLFSKCCGHPRNRCFSRPPTSQGERAESSFHPLRVAVDQPHRDTWRLRVAFQEGAYDARQRDAFFELFERSLGMLRCGLGCIWGGAGSGGSPSGDSGEAEREGSPTRRAEPVSQGSDLDDSRCRRHRPRPSFGSAKTTETLWTPSGTMSALLMGWPVAPIVVPPLKFPMSYRGDAVGATPDSVQHSAPQTR